MSKKTRPGKHRESKRSTDLFRGPWLTKAFFCKAYKDKSPTSYADCFSDIAQSPGIGGTSSVDAFLVIEFAVGEAVGLHHLEVVKQPPGAGDELWGLVDQEIEFFEGVNYQTLYLDVTIDRDRVGTWHYMVALDDAMYVRLPLIVLPAPLIGPDPVRPQA